MREIQRYFFDAFETIDVFGPVEVIGKLDRPGLQLPPVFVRFGNQKGVFNEKRDNVFSQHLSLVQ